VYRLDGAGKISNAEWIEADGDARALEEARTRLGRARFELWERNRLVARSSDSSG
jgi:hypothetical protein